MQLRVILFDFRYSLYGICTFSVLSFGGEHHVTACHTRDLGRAGLKINQILGPDTYVVS